jgi:hypothetical protein
LLSGGTEREIKDPEMNRTTFGIAIALLAIAVALPPGLDPFAQSPDTFTAKATPGNEIENAASITITFVVNRYTTESENTTVRNALEQGPSALRAALKSMPELGAITVASKRIGLKYAYKRPQNAGQTITLLADEPLGYLDSGGTADKPTEGYDLTLAILDFSTPGFAVGELNPAVKVGLNSTGMIVTQEYGGPPLMLTSVEKK